MKRRKVRGVLKYVKTALLIAWATALIPIGVYFIDGETGRRDMEGKLNLLEDRVTTETDQIQAALIQLSKHPSILNPNSPERLDLIRIAERTLKKGYPDVSHVWTITVKDNNSAIVCREGVEESIKYVNRESGDIPPLKRLFVDSRPSLWVLTDDVKAPNWTKPSDISCQSHIVNKFWKSPEMLTSGRIDPVEEGIRDALAIIQPIIDPTSKDVIGGVYAMLNLQDLSEELRSIAGRSPEEVQLCVPYKHFESQESRNEDQNIASNKSMCDPGHLPGSLMGIVSPDYIRPKVVDGYWSIRMHWPSCLSVVQWSLLVSILLGLCCIAAMYLRRLRIRSSLSEQSYEALVDTMQSAVLRISHNDKIVYLNRHAEELFGSGLSRSTLTSIVAPGDIDKVTRLMKEVRTGAIETVRNWNIGARNRHIYMNWVNRLLPVNLDGQQDVLCVGTDISELKKTQTDLTESNREQEISQQELRKSNENLDTIVSSVYPKSVLRKMRVDGKLDIDACHPFRTEVGVMFCDIVGFTAYSSQTPPEEVVDELAKLFAEFDSVIEQFRKHNVEKIKSIGDGYMCVSGLDGEVDLGALIRCGFGMIRSARTAAGHAKQRFDLRVGLDKGIAVGGILGSKRRMFDIWGDCVNRAARLEGAATLNAVCLRKTVFKDLTGTYAHKNKAEPVFLKGFPERVDVVDLFPSD